MIFDISVSKCELEGQLTISHDLIPFVSGDVVLRASNLSFSQSVWWK